MNYEHHGYKSRSGLLISYYNFNCYINVFDILVYEGDTPR